jgi:hypothetical protein
MFDILEKIGEGDQDADKYQGNYDQPDFKTTDLYRFFPG